LLADFFGAALRDSDFEALDSEASDFVPLRALFDEVDEVLFFEAPDDFPLAPAFFEQFGQAPQPCDA
jgi:hypothetical protein